jgi:hypothetical protein
MRSSVQTPVQQKEKKKKQYISPRFIVPYVFSFEVFILIYESFVFRSFLGIFLRNDGVCIKSEFLWDELSVPSCGG